MIDDDTGEPPDMRKARFARLFALHRQVIDADKPDRPARQDRSMPPGVAESFLAQAARSLRDKPRA